MKSDNNTMELQNYLVACGVLATYKEYFTYGMRESELSLLIHTGWLNQFKYLKSATEQHFLTNREASEYVVEQSRKENYAQIYAQVKNVRIHLLFKETKSGMIRVFLTPVEEIIKKIHNKEDTPSLDLASYIEMALSLTEAFVFYSLEINPSYENL